MIAGAVGVCAILFPYENESLTWLRSHLGANYFRLGNHVARNPWEVISYLAVHVIVRFFLSRFCFPFCFLALNFYYFVGKAVRH